MSARIFVMPAKMVRVGYELTAADVVIICKIL
jgi:hypothetical protein